MSKLTPTLLAALRALQDHGGNGVITATGTLLAGGEELAHDDGPQPQKYHSVTWLRLVAAGMVERVGDGRLGLTVAGLTEAGR